jgi:hypothetical protein
MTQSNLRSTHFFWEKSFVFALVLLWGLILPVFLSAQNDDELLENFFRDNESASESDAQQFLEYLESLRDRPLNLNRATREDLRALHLLNDLQVERFLEYRDRFGPFLSEYELQAVPSWELSDIRRVLQFSSIKTGLETRNTNIFKGLYRGDNEVLLRWSLFAPPNYVDSLAEGPPNVRAVRYRHAFDNRLRFGFTAESDAGEALFRKSNPRGFDFYSAHLFVQNWNKNVRAVALGDYSARFGQGLLLQTGFSPGKSAETVAVTRGGRKLNAYAAFGEAFFFRGAATTLAFGKRVEVTALYSDRRRDGNLNPDTIDFFDERLIVFSSLQTSGYHRTATEIEDEKALREQIGGISATYKAKNGQITANGLHIEYSKPWLRAQQPYNQFAFRGKRITGLSLDYDYRWRNLFVFGETARSDNGAIASLNGLLFSPDRHVTLTAVHRSLAKDYQSIYAAPFAEVAGASNERGLYLGADVRWVRRWQLNFYADVWRHPWLRFGVDAPSQGREFLARVLWTKSRSFSAYLLWQSEIKERNSGLEQVPGLVNNRRDRLRLHAIYRASKAVEFRSRVEWTTFQAGQFQHSKGFVAYQEAVIKPLGSAFSTALRYAIFDTDDFDSRVYAFENDLFAAISIPALAGRGSRYYMNLQWRVNRWLRLEGRIEQTNTLRAATIGGATGKEMIWKLQARLRW